MGSLLDHLTQRHLELQMKGGETEDRLAVLDALWARRGDRGLVEKAVELLKDPVDQVRRNASYLLIEYASRDGAEAVASILSSDRAEVQSIACDTLVGMGRLTVPVVVRYLNHRSAEARRCALEVLGRLATRSYSDEIAVLLGDADEKVVAAAVDALGAIGSADHLDDLRVIYNKRPPLRARVAAALGSMDAAAALDLLGKALSDSDADVRQAAELALGNHPSPRAAQLLHSHQPEVPSHQGASSTCL